MKAKRLISFSIMTVLLCSSLCGCGDDGKSKSDVNEGSQNSFANENNAMETPDNSESDGDGDSISTEPTTEPLLMHIDDAREYSSGVAWVKSGTKWNIVDTSGTVKNSFSENYTIVTDFEGGFSIIDPDATIYMNGRIETSAQAIVIDTNGDTVLDLQSAGYSGFKNYDGLAEGSIIVEKNIDTFEKSGDFFYHFDLNTGIEKEICADKEESDKGYKENCDFDYMGNGFYIRSLWDGMSGTIYQSKEVLVFHNYISDEVLSFRDDPSIIETLDGNTVFKSWDVYRVNEKLICDINDRFFFIDLNKKSCTPAILDYSVIDIDYIDTEIDMHVDINGTDRDYVDIGNGYFLCRWGDLIRINYETENHYFDFVKNKYHHFKPNCDYSCNIVDYKGDFFLVTTENENETIFYTVIDGNMNPLFSPKRYKDTTTLFDDYLISDEDDGSVSITRISSMSTIKNISNSTVIYVDEANKCVWINNNQETTECYSIETGELLFSISGICDIYSDFNDGLALIVNNTLGEIMYVDTTGEQLKILDNSI